MTDTIEHRAMDEALEIEIWKCENLFGESGFVYLRDMKGTIVGLDGPLFYGQSGNKDIPACLREVH